MDYDLRVDLRRRRVFFPRRTLLVRRPSPTRRGSISFPSAITAFSFGVGFLGVNERLRLASAKRAFVNCEASIVFHERKSLGSSRLMFGLGGS